MTATSRGSTDAATTTTTSIGTSTTRSDFAGRTPSATAAREPETGLITACDLTPANGADGVHGIALLDGEPAGLDVLADSAYGTGPARAALETAGHTAIIKPWPLARNPALGDDQLHRDEFHIDYINRTVTCPNGITVTIATKGTASFGQRCTGCPLRTRCTANRSGKTFTITEHDQLLAAARQQWRDRERPASAPSESNADRTASINDQTTPPAFAEHPPTATNKLIAGSTRRTLVGGLGFCVLGR